MRRPLRIPLAAGGVATLVGATAVVAARLPLAPGEPEPADSSMVRAALAPGAAPVGAVPLLVPRAVPDPSAWRPRVVHGAPRTIVVQVAAPAAAPHAAAAPPPTSGASPAATDDGESKAGDD
jgi:hypothetical protein